MCENTRKPTWGHGEVFLSFVASGVAGRGLVGGFGGSRGGFETINQLMSTAQVTVGFHLPYYMANQLFQPRNST